MASERLTDARLGELLTSFETAHMAYVTRDLIASAVAEIQERRALDLAADERDALAAMRDCKSCTRMHALAVQALDKLLARGAKL